MDQPVSDDVLGSGLMPSHPDGRTVGPLPAVVFAMRFGNDDGVVQKFFAQHRDLAAGELTGRARFYLAFVRLGDESAYTPRWSTEVQADFYDMSREGRDRIARFVAGTGVRLVVFQGASPDEIDTTFFRRLGVVTANTEDSSFDADRTQPPHVAIAKFVLRRILKRNLHALYIANAERQAERMLKFVKLPPGRVRTVRCGIDTDQYSPGPRADACRRLGLDPDTIWIMAAAQSRPVKRVDCLIQSVKRVMDARPDRRIGFFYVGGGEKLQAWRELAETVLPEGDWRCFGGQAEMPIFYRAASIFIHAAMSESFGLVITEAMASELPVVATMSDGPAEIVEHGKTGALVGQDDWSGLDEAILRYIDSPELRQTHGEAGRRRVVTNFAMSRAATELAACLGPLIAG